MRLRDGAWSSAIRRGRAWPGRLVRPGGLALLFVGLLVASPVVSASSGGRADVPWPNNPAKAPEAGSPWKAWVTVSLQAERYPASSGYDLRAKLAWTSTGGARNGTSQALKGTGKFYANIGATVSDASSCSPYKYSLSGVGNTFGEGALTFRISPRDRRFPERGLSSWSITTPSAAWLSRLRTQDSCGTNDRDWQDQFYPVTFGSTRAQGAPLTKLKVFRYANAIVIAGSGTSAATGQTVAFRITCTKPLACFGVKAPPTSTPPPETNTDPTREEATRTKETFRCEKVTTSGDKKQVQIDAWSESWVTKMPKKPERNVSDPYTIYQETTVAIQRRALGGWQSYTSYTTRGGYTANASKAPSYVKSGVRYLLSEVKADGAGLRILTKVKVKYGTKTGRDQTIWEYEVPSSPFSCPYS